MSTERSKELVIENIVSNRQIITLKKHSQANMQDQWATYKMRRPSSSSNQDDIIMTISADDEKALNCYHIMRQVNHVNILKAYNRDPFNKDGKSYFYVAVERFDNILIDIISSSSHRLFERFGPTSILRGELLKDIVKGLIEGLSCLHAHNYYHGNISLENTYIVHEDCGTGKIVKLADFHYIRSSPKLLVKNKRRDWHMLGILLEQLVGILTSVEANRNVHCSEIRHLASFFKTARDINTIESMAFSHIIFWRQSNYAEYIAVSIPLLLRDRNFRAKLENTNICSIPWNSDSYGGLLHNMKETYNGNRIVDFVRFVSAAYNHFEEIDDVYVKESIGDKLKNLHQYITKRHPELCHQLKLIEESNRN